MTEIIVSEDLLCTIGLVNAFDHRVVVQFIGEDQAVRNELGDRRYAGLVCDVSRGEHQRRLLCMQVRKLSFQFHQGMVGPCDVAGTAGSGSQTTCRVDHRLDHHGALAHAEIVVRAPDRYLPGTAARMPDGARQLADNSLKIDERPVPLFLLQAEGGTFENRFEIAVDGALEDVPRFSRPGSDAFRGISGGGASSRCGGFGVFRLRHSTVPPSWLGFGPARISLRLGLPPENRLDLIISLSYTSMEDR